MSGACTAGRNCRSLHIAEPARGTFNEEHIKFDAKQWGAGLQGQMDVKDKICRINFIAVQTSRATTPEIRCNNEEAIRRIAAETGLFDLLGDLRLSNCILYVGMRPHSVTKAVYRIDASRWEKQKQNGPNADRNRMPIETDGKGMG